MRPNKRTKLPGRIMAVLFFLLLICSIFTASKIASWQTPVFDTITGNEIVQEVKKSWNHLESLSNVSFPYEFSVINHSGNLLYQTKNASSLTLSGAFRNHDTVIDIEKDNKIIGKVIISSLYASSLAVLKDEIMTDLMMIVSLLFLFIITTAILIRHFILKPFSKLKTFASEIAAGNLEVPLEMDRYNLFGAFTESFDIMREELSLSRQRENEANQKKKELVASLSHDIKTPVTSIKLISELLLATNKDDRTQEKLKNIYGKADQIDCLVSDMFQSALEDLSELKAATVEELSTCLDSIVENADYKHFVKKEPVPHCMIRTDKVRLTQVINNIITNSYKYAGTQIFVSYQIEDNYLFLNIEDLGAGVNELELPHLFHKFYRSSSSFVQSQTGSGLGLYISKQLMNLMEGDIVCSNTKDGFLVQLTVKLA